MFCHWPSNLVVKYLFCSAENQEFKPCHPKYQTKKKKYECFTLIPLKRCVDPFKLFD